MKTYKIYTIRDITLDKIVYVGHTDQELEDRFNQHKRDTTHPEKVEYLKNNKCEIELLHNTTEMMVETVENKYINKYDTIKNGLNRIQAKSTHTDAVLKQKEAEAKCKAIIKKGKKPIEKIEEDQYGRSKSIDYTGKTEIKWKGLFK